MSNPDLGQILPSTSQEDFPPLLEALRGLIAQARREAVRSVNALQVQTYWQIGRHIVEFEQGGEARAVHGKALLIRLAESLTREFGKGFDASNLRYMRLFYHAFPNCDALRHELSWTHYRLLQRVDSPGGGGGMSARFSASQRDTAYQPRARLWVGNAPDPRVLKERRISPKGGRGSDQPLCGVPSERMNGILRIPRVSPWAGMHCSVGASNPAD